MNLGKKSIYQHIGEAHYLYNQIRWTIAQIGWWYYKEEKPKYMGEKWKLFGKWMDSKYEGHENYMNTGDILRTVIKDEYMCKLYKHIVTMRGLFTHFFCDDALYESIYKKEYNPNDGIDGLPIVSCGKSEQPEVIDEHFLFTFNYYCLKLYNLLANFITENMDSNYDSFRFDLRLRRGNVVRNLHPRWDFDNFYKKTNS